MVEATITEKQLACLHWAALGKTSWETATILGVSERTVNFHIESACRNLRVSGRQAAITLLFIAGLLPATSQPQPRKVPAIRLIADTPDPSPIDSPETINTAQICHKGDVL